MLERLSAWSVLGGLLLVTLACDAQPAEPTTAPTNRAATSKHRPPDRGRVLGGEHVQRTVAWPEIDALDTSLRGRLGAEASNAIAVAKVPVLLPSSEALLPRLEIVNGPTWTAIWSAAQGYTIALHISGAARVHPGIGPVEGRDVVRGRPAFVTQNEGIWIVSWIENGVAYDLSLECEAPGEGPCRGDVFVRDLVESLTFVGPGEDER